MSQDLSAYLGKRITIGSDKATIRYAGPLLHPVTGNLISKINHLWFGIEWDSAGKGSHNGTVSDVQYFCPKTSNPEVNQCSLVLDRKVSKGNDILEAIVKRYFQAQEAAEILANKKDIVEILQAKSHENRNKDTTTINTEFDETGFIYTFGERTKKIEFMGFDKHWKKIHTLDARNDLGLTNQAIQDFGSIGSLGALTRSVTMLALEDNLLVSWEQVVHLGYELPNLEQLELSYNKLEIPENFAAFTKFNTYNETGEVLEIEKPFEVFKNLKTLILIGMGLTWEQLSKIAMFFPSVTELNLCSNTCNDFENIDATVLESWQGLQRLNISKNQIVKEGLPKACMESAMENFVVQKKSQNSMDEEILPGVSEYPDHKLELLHHFKFLRDLKIASNQIHTFPDAQKYENLSYIDIEHNNISDYRIIIDLSHCIPLENIRVLKNPITTVTSDRHMTCLVVGAIRNLNKVNGSDLKRGDRKDHEIYYTRWVFEEYFKLKNTRHEDYLESEFFPWATAEFPNVIGLIAEFGNPYPQLFGVIFDENTMQETPQVTMPNQQYKMLQWTSLYGPSMGKKMQKKFPASTDLLYIRSWAKQWFKIKDVNAVDIKFRNNTKDVFETIPENQMTKDLNYFGVQSNAEFIFDEKIIAIDH